MNLLIKTTAALLLAATAICAPSCSPSQQTQPKQNAQASPETELNYLEDIAQQKNASLEQNQKKESRPIQYSY